MTLYYTYSHAKPDGSVFYIGKGMGNRAYKFNSRNRYWKHVVKKHGTPLVEILGVWDTEEDALKHEIFLIACFKDLGYKLTNITDGGEGVSGLKWTEASKQKLSNSKLGVKFTNRGASSVKKGDTLSEKRANQVRQALVKARASITPKIGIPVTKVECPHCHHIGGIGAMNRWHFNNCKDKL
jgi:hypothetical protein